VISITVVSISILAIFESNSGAVNQNHLSIANAGLDQTVQAHDLLTLNGSMSRDNDGKIISYTWKQITGPSLDLKNSSTATPRLIARALSKDTQIKYSLTVKDNKGAISNPDTTVVTIKATPYAAGESTAIYTLIKKSQDLAEQGNTSEAMLYYDKVLSIDPNNVNALNAKAETLNREGNFTGSIQYYDKALAVNDTNLNLFTDTLNGKGDVYFNQGNYTAATQWNCWIRLYLLIQILLRH
jgi:tetratricopeptide (TPR) repeat protein